MKPKFIILLLFPAVFMLNFCSLAGSGGSGGVKITYDNAVLYVGNKIVFDGSGNTGAEKYEWSYKSSSDDQYTVVNGWTNSKATFVFIVPGDYTIKLNISDDESGTVEITIMDQALDLNNPISGTGSTGLVKLLKNGANYDLSLRLRDQILELIRADKNEYVYFDIYSTAMNGSTLGALVSTEYSKGDSGSSPPDFPAIVEFQSLSADDVRLLSHIAHMICVMPAGQALSVKYYASPQLITVIPEILPAEFYFYY